MSFPLDDIPKSVLEEQCAKVQGECKLSNYMNRVPQDFYNFEVLYISDGKLLLSRGDHFHPLLVQAYNKTKQAVEKDTKVLPYSIEQLSIKMNKPELFQDAMCRILAIGFPTETKKLFTKLSEELVSKTEELRVRDPAFPRSFSLTNLDDLEFRVKKIEDICNSLQKSLYRVSGSLKQLTEKVKSLDDSSKVITANLANTNDLRQPDDLLTMNFIRRALEFEGKRWRIEVANFTSTYLDSSQLKKLKSCLICIRTIHNTLHFFSNIFEIICDKDIAVTCRFPSFEGFSKKKKPSHHMRQEIPTKELNKILDFLRIFDFVTEDGDEPNIFKTIHGWNTVKNRYNRWGLNCKDSLRNPKKRTEVREVSEVSEEPADTFITYDIICDDDESLNTSNPQELGTNSAQPSKDQEKVNADPVKLPKNPQELSTGSVQHSKDQQEVNPFVVQPPNKVLRTYTRSAARNGSST